MRIVIYSFSCHMNQVSERMAIINFNSHSDQMIRFFVSSTHQHESRIEEKSIQYA